MITIQFTLFDKTGKYKPVSTLITVDNAQEYLYNKDKYKKKAIERICIKRGWTRKDLKKYGYTSYKTRVYNKEKIEAEKQARYKAKEEAEK